MTGVSGELFIVILQLACILSYGVMLHIVPFLKIRMGQINCFSVACSF